MRTLRRVVRSCHTTTHAPDLWFKARVWSNVVADEVGEQIVEICSLGKGVHPSPDDKVDHFCRDEFDWKQWEHHKRAFGHFRELDFERVSPILPFQRINDGFCPLLDAVHEVKKQQEMSLPDS